MYTKRNFAVMPRTIGGLIEDVFQNGRTYFNEEVTAFSAPVNIQETDKTYEVSLVAPGLKKEDFKIAVDRDLLKISYDHKEETTEQQENKWIRNEYRMKSFKRTFTLNEKIDSANISAKYADGILAVSLPKKETAEPTAHEITIN